MERVFKVPVVRVFCGCVYVEADSAQEAARIAADNMDSDFVREQNFWPSEWELDTDNEPEEIDPDSVDEYEVINSEQ